LFTIAPNFLFLVGLTGSGNEIVTVKEQP